MVITAYRAARTRTARGAPGLVPEERETDALRHKYAYFPFLGGPRKCIGDQLAILEAKIILTKVLQRARYARVPGHKVIADPTVTLRMLNGLRVTAKSAVP